MQPNQNAVPATTFSGSVPQHYDRELGPLLFEFSATDMANRVAAAVGSRGRVLEVACGTGILTEILRETLPSGVEIVATDLNPDMLAFARRRGATLEGITFEQADALNLPYADGGFDVVVCQFGIMFFADKQRGFSELARVLKPGGTLLWNVWGSMDDNPVIKVAHQAIGRLLDGQPLRFLEIPFGFYDHAANEALASGAQLEEIESATVDARIRHRASSTARGLVQGTPGVAEIKARASTDLASVTRAVRDELRKTFGADAPEFGLREHVFRARKPQAAAM